MVTVSESVPVLLLHGFLGNPEDWDAVLDAWSPQKQVYPLSLVSLVGQPSTSVSDHVQILDRMLSAILAMLDGHDIEVCDMVGYSMGGRIAWLFAHHYPHRVRRLCILSATPGISDPETRRMREVQDRAWGALLRSVGMSDFLTFWYAQPLFDSFREHFVFQNVVQRRALEDTEVQAQILEGCSPALQPDLWDWVLASQIPTLYLSGEKDLRYTQIGNRLLANRDIRCEVLPCVGHVLHLEAPQAVAMALGRFLI